MDGHWLTGYGYVSIGPGTDNSNFFWEHKDFTNVYIAILARFGLMGLLPFLLVNFMFYRKLFVAARMCRDPADLWLIWCIASALVGWNIAFLTVSSFRQVVTLLYIFIAICNNLPDMVRVAALAGAPAPVPEQRPFVGYHRRPWRYNNGRRFSGDRQLERPGIPPQVSQVPPEG